MKATKTTVEPRKAKVVTYPLVKRDGAFWRVLTASGVALYSSMQRKNATEWLQQNFPQAT